MKENENKLNLTGKQDISIMKMKLKVMAISTAGAAAIPDLQVYGCLPLLGALCS